MKRKTRFSEFGEVSMDVDSEYDFTQDSSPLPAGFLDQSPLRDIEFDDGSLPPEDDDEFEDMDFTQAVPQRRRSSGSSSRRPLTEIQQDTHADQSFAQDEESMDNTRSTQDDSGEYTTEQLSPPLNERRVGRSSGS